VSEAKEPISAVKGDAATTAAAFAAHVTFHVLVSNRIMGSLLEPLA
jgi:hypothetical protein